MANYYTIEEVAQRLSLSPKTITRYINAGDLLAHRFGRRTRISPEHLEDFLASRVGSTPVRQRNTRASMRDLLAA